MAGTSFIDFMGFRILYKAYPADRVKVLVFNDYLYRLQRFMGFGMLIILASGVAMMIKLHALWGAQLWFRIKMGFLLLIIINGLLLRRNAGNALNHILSKNDPMNNTDRQRGWARSSRIASNPSRAASRAQSKSAPTIPRAVRGSTAG